MLPQAAYAAAQSLPPPIDGFVLFESVEVDGLAHSSDPVGLEVLGDAHSSVEPLDPHTIS